jgi:PAS domain S-box-containing protein
MTDQFFDGISSAAVKAYVIETAPVLAIRIDAHNRVVELNAQARRLLGDDTVGRPLASKVADSPGILDIRKLMKGGETVSRVTFNTVSGLPETLYFRFFPTSDGVLALGSLDLAEQQKLFGEMRALNGELNNLTRKLQQANAELCELNELKTKYSQDMQEKNDNLRLQTLASLNLMEDALEARDRLQEANRALRDSEAQFRFLVEGAPDTILVITDFVISYVNPAACRLFGASSAEQLLGQAILDCIHPSMHQLVHSRIHKVFDKQESAPTVEQLWVRLDGTSFPVEVSSVPISYLGKDSALTYARDITERKKAEEALRRSEDRYRSILEAAPDAVVIANGEGRIVLVNTQAETMFGYSREALLRSNVASLFPERERSSHLQRRAAYFANFQAQVMGTPIETLGLRADGTEFPIEARLSPLKVDGNELVLAAYRDVTEQRQAEQRRLQLEIKVAEAETANKAKSVFLSTMSHEIRTPMNAILGYSQLMLRDPQLGADAQANLKIINRSGEHLLNIINNILDMAKIEAGRLQVTSKVFDIRSLLCDLENMFRLRAEGKGLQFEVQVSGEPVTQITADDGKIRQVLINLLGNAIKFTERGRVSLRVHLARNSNRGLQLSAQVDDTGVGMTPEEQNEVFQPFAQGQSGQRVQHGGTGLGLAISLGMAHLMGGDITMSSQPGRGSTFRFEMPVERGDDGDLPRHAELQRRVLGIVPGQAAPRILIADDLLDNREWLTKLLTCLGFSVRSAANGEAAVLAWGEWSPQLILMDVHMPVMNGLEATREIKSRPSGKNTVIVALTADAMEDHRQLAFENDIDDFISKPCIEGELLEKIRKHLDLTYVYAEEPPGEATRPATNAATHQKPGSIQPGGSPLDLVPGMREAMREAIVHGDKARLDGLISTIEERGDAQTAKALRELADRYQYDRLIEWLENACFQ